MIEDLCPARRDDFSAIYDAEDSPGHSQGALHDVSFSVTYRQYYLDKPTSF